MTRAEFLPPLPALRAAQQAGEPKEILSARSLADMLFDEIKNPLCQADGVFGLPLGVGLVGHAGKGQGVRIPCRDVVLIEDLRGILALTKGGVIPHGLLKKFPE